MKKTKTRTLKLHRETLRHLAPDELRGLRGRAIVAEGTDTGDWCSNPSCIDGCPTALGCTSHTIEA